MAYRHSSHTRTSRTAAGPSSGSANPRSRRASPRAKCLQEGCKHSRRLLFAHCARDASVLAVVHRASGAGGGRRSQSRERSDDRTRRPRHSFRGVAQASPRRPRSYAAACSRVVGQLIRRSFSSIAAISRGERRLLLFRLCLPLSQEPASNGHVGSAHSRTRTVRRALLVLTGKSDWLAGSGRRRVATRNVGAWRHEHRRGKSARDCRFHRCACLCHASRERRLPRRLDGL